MTKKLWRFYVLEGRSRSGGAFFKVGTSGPIFGYKSLFKPLKMRGRMNYGAYVDPSMSASKRRRANSVYRPSKKHNRLSYNPPRLSPKAVADPIEWECIFSHAFVRRKELDQIIAAVADDAGMLVANRGSFLKKSSGIRYRGAIEIIDGSTDIIRLLSSIVSTHLPSRAKYLSKSDKKDINNIIRRMKRLGF